MNGITWEFMLRDCKRVRESVHCEVLSDWLRKQGLCDNFERLIKATSCDTVIFTMIIFNFDQICEFDLKFDGLLDYKFLRIGG